MTVDQNGVRERNGRSRRWAGAVGISVALAVTVLPAAAANADTQASHFIQVSRTSNNDTSATYIKNGATNGYPDALLFVTPNYSPGGVCINGGSSCVVDTSPIGVFYGTNDEWGIFNENESAMPTDAAFNVLVEPVADANAFVVTATSESIGGTDSTYTLIDNPATNNNPDAILQATQTIGTGTMYNNHPIGVSYNTTAGEWAVFNEDGAPMTVGVSFNILVGTTATGGGKAITQVARSTNTGGNSTHINNEVTNGDANAFVLETPNWNPKGIGGTSDTSQTGVWFNSGQIVIFNEDGTTMAKKEAFNALMFNS